MINIFRCYVYLSILISLMGCVEKKQSEEIIINDCFLDVIGTQGYWGKALIPIPPRGGEKHDPNPNLNIEVSEKMRPLKDWDNSIKYFISNQKGFDDYKKLFTDYFKKKEIPGNLDINKITRTGRYKILTNKNATEKNIIGKVEFSNVAYNKNIAAFFVTISNGPKSGFEKLILLKKDRSVWKVIFEDIFMIW